MPCLREKQVQMSGDKPVLERVFRGCHVDEGLAQKFLFFLLCGLQFKLCLLQFWPLLSEELLLNDGMIHSANRNYTLTAPKFCQWTHRRFSLLFSALQSNLSVLD